jgi:hypothetical protein
MFRQLRSIAASSLALLILAGFQPALADGPGRTLVGSWEVSITNDQGLPPALDLSTVNQDGTMTNSDSLLGTGHGVWKRAGNGRFKMKFRTPILATASGPPLFFPFPPGSVLTVTATAMVAVDGMTAFGPYQAVVHAPDGAGGVVQVFDFDGDIALSRITVD